MKVFLSWSGEKSRHVALALRDWLPFVINSVVPFVSSEDIDAGSRWQREVSDELELTNYGIVCVTRGNQTAQWLNFEAGALAKTVELSHVIPLLVDLSPGDITGPFAQFQAKTATEDGLREVIQSMNRVLESPRPPDQLERAFEKWWPDLREKLDEISAKEWPEPKSDPRTDRELLEEALDTVRSIARADEAEASDDKVERMGRHARFPRQVALWAREAGDFVVGVKVQHANFGRGEVIGVEPGGVIVVRFDHDASERKLMWEYAPVSIVSDSE